MAMKMLEAGGLEIVVDNVRTADEDNPKGYYEDERVKDLAEMDDKSWLRDARGKVIKVVSSLLNYLPETTPTKWSSCGATCTRFWLRRPRCSSGAARTSHTEDEDLLAMYESHLEKVQFQLRFRPYFEALYVNYSDVVQDPAAEARKMADFLGGGLDIEEDGRQRSTVRSTAIGGPPKAKLRTGTPTDGRCRE